MKTLYTVGYEGASLSDFILTLQANGIDTILDVREIPVSRRKGFSKKILAEELGRHGIAYRHERALGSPKPLRDQLHRDGDYHKFFKLFASYIITQDELLTVLAGSLEGSVSLLCYERDHTTCHRSIVAKQIEAITGLSTHHLTVKKYGNVNATVVYSSKGLSSTQQPIWGDGLLCGA